MLYERQERSQLRKYKDFNENLKRKALMLNWLKLFYTQKIYTSNWACNLLDSRILWFWNKPSDKL